MQPVKYKLADLIDIPRVQALLDSLYAAYSFPSAIIDNESNILTASGWQDVCTKFHRVHPEANRLCRKSDLYVLEHLHDARPWVRYQCPHGLTDTATPIIIDGEHVGNVFTGQFFLEPPDLDAFRRRAQQFGFAEEAYLAAVAQAPVLSGEQFERILGIVHKFTELLAEMGLKRRRELEQAEQYRMIYEHLNDAFYAHDFAGRIIDCNGNACRMLGYAREELVGENMAKIGTAEGRKLLPERLARIRVSDEIRFESVHVRKDGGLVPVEVSARVVSRQGDGQIHGFVRDITERRRAEEQLRTSEKRNRELLAESDRSRRALLGILEDQQQVEAALREANRFNQQVIASAADGIIVYGRDLRYLVWNAAMEKITGYPAAEVLGRQPLELFPFLRDAGVIARLEQALAGESPEPVEFPYATADGRSGWTLDTSSPLRDLSGAVIGVIATVRETTARHQAEAKLRASEEHYRSLFASAADGILIMTAQGRILTVNESFAAMHGYTVAEIMRMNIRDLDVLRGDALDRRGDVLRRIMAGETLRFEVEHYHKAGHVITLQVTTNAIHLEGQPHILAFHQDVTSIRQAQNRMYQSEKLAALGRLAAGTAHELNQPLNAIKNFCQALLILQDEGRPLTAARVKENLTLAVQQIDRMAELIRSMRIFARQEKQENVEPLDLNELAREPFTMLGSQLHAHAIAHEIHPAAAPLLVMGNHSRLLQVMINLITNARDAIQQRQASGGEEMAGAITVLCRREQAGGLAVVEVHDTGVGVKPEDLPHLFEPFFTAKDRTDSVGLGLAISYEIVHAHGGDIRVNSEPGNGATFIVTLPLAEQRDAQAGDDAGD